MGSSERYLVGDVGGTNCRLAACDPSTGLIDKIRIMPVEDFQSLAGAINAYTDASPSYKLLRASISIANPIVGDQITMTNAHWDFSIEETRKICQLERLMMLNDWESVALSLPILRHQDLKRINERQANDSGNRALCGVGTGLGVSGLVKGRYSDDWCPIAAEGGHVSFSPVTDEEAQILDMFRETTEHVSFERILSGAGLVALYQAVSRMVGSEAETLSPQEIVSNASSQTDLVCVRTIEMFSGIIGNFAGNLCLTLGATGGIYIGGGVVQKIEDAGVFNREIFLDRLTRKGRLAGWLTNIPAYLITTPYAGLVGAAAALGVKNPRVGP